MARLETVENADLEEQERPLFVWRHIDNVHRGVHWRFDHAVPEGGPPAQEVSLVPGIARRPDDQSQATEGDLAGAALDKGTCWNVELISSIKPIDKEISITLDLTAYDRV